MCSTVSAAVEGVVAAAGGPAAEILALVELADRAQAALVERVGVFDAAEGWAADGAYSFPCWLRARADVTRAESLRLGRFARTLATMPVTEGALHHGELSVAKARLLAGVVNERTEERFAEQEEFLVDQVQALPVESAKTALDYWKRLADSDGPDPSDPAENWARLTQSYRGRWHLEASLDHLSGTMLKAVLDAIVERMHHDGRFNDLPRSANTATHRTAQAVVEMGHRASGARPGQPAVHPDIVVVVPHHALTEPEPDPFDPPTLLGGGPLTLSEVGRLALFGTVSTLTIDDAGRPLRLGRKQRLATNDQWIAASVRDRAASPRAVTAPPPGAKPTTSTGGNATAGPRTWRTSPWSAATTTTSSTTPAGCWNHSPTAPGTSPAPTGPPSPTPATPTTSDHHPDTSSQQPEHPKPQQPRILPKRCRAGGVA